MRVLQLCLPGKTAVDPIKSMRKMQLAKRGKKPAPKDDGKKAKA